MAKKQEQPMVPYAPLSLSALKNLDRQLMEVETHSTLAPEEQEKIRKAREVVEGLRYNIHGQ